MFLNCRTLTDSCLIYLFIDLRNLIRLLKTLKHAKENKKTETSVRGEHVMIKQ